MFRSNRDAEVERTHVDLDGAHADTRVHLRAVPVSVRASGKRRLVDVDATLAWLDALGQLELHRLRRKQSTCEVCAAPLPPAPVALGPVTLDTPADTTGTVTLTAAARVCPACGAAHVARLEQFASDFMDAVIDAMTSAGVER
ncbi:hypothetical protein [Egicoccus sp. AB-alg2]|uniref:hypothetical protein n=1 Tax=Egicoccus sp. AB-alg2 TaxID=3242693 RepID=UPI00359E6E07